MKLAPRLIRGPVLSARSDTSIAECIRLMRTHWVGALLITSPDDRGELVGIFTERDLLERVELIRDTNTWTKPIRHVMTKNPRTVSLGKLYDIPRLMLKVGARHVPVVEVVNGIKRPVGVISMRDCFRFLYETGAVDPAFQLGSTEAIGKKRGRKPFALVSVGDAIARIIGASFDDEIDVFRMNPSMQAMEGGITPELTSFAALIVDIDGRSAGSWTDVLRQFSGPNLPPVLVTFDPTAHGEKEAAVLAKLSKTKRFHVFTKPLHLVEFVGLLTELLSKTKSK